MDIGNNFICLLTHLETWLFILYTHYPQGTGCSCNLCSERKKETNFYLNKHDKTFPALDRLL